MKGNERLAREFRTIYTVYALLNAGGLCVNDVSFASW